MMRSYDLASSVFWLVLSLSVSIESLRLGIGTVRNPGMGFFAFVVSGLLGILSLIVLLQSFLQKSTSKTEPLRPKMLWKRVILVLIALLIYSKWMPSLGYLVSTFGLMILLFWVLEPTKKWLCWASLVSALTTLLSYFVFSILLNCQFPAGLFGR
jgi:putative tricarboxylic transport membrane protein